MSTQFDLDTIRREACIIAPCPDTSFCKACDELQVNLAKMFGGFNRTEAFGAWHDGEKLVLISYDHDRFEFTFEQLSQTFRYQLVFGNQNSICSSRCFTLWHSES